MLEADVPAGARRARPLGGARVRIHARARARARAAARDGHRRCPPARAAPFAARGAHALSARRRSGPPSGSGRASAPRSRSCAAASLGAAELGRRAGCDHSTLRSLERRGLLRLENALEPPRRPQPAQRRRALGAGRADLRTRPPRWRRSRARLDAGAGTGPPLLLHGVTGSGKTEVYLRAVAAALERGRSAIVLVPEIALTPQTAGRFVERFGDAVAVMHSQLSQRERYDEWWRMRRGEARVCVGPALRRLRALRRPRPDRRRRGARRLLQAGGRSALRRAHRRGAARRCRRARCSWRAARPRAPESVAPLRAHPAAAPGRRPRPAAR